MIALYERLRIQNYRCFEDLEIGDLARVNLIAGENNSGKTALLEAIYLLASDPPHAALAQALRDVDGERLEDREGWRTLWPRLFRGMDATQPIRIAAGPDGTGAEADLAPSDRDSVARGAVLWTHRQPTTGESSQWVVHPEHLGANPVVVGAPRSVVKFVPATGRVQFVEEFGELVRNTREAPIVEAVTMVEPRLRGLLLLPRTGGELALYGDIGAPKRMLLTDMGEGMNRLAAIAIALASSAGGVTLIDEVESGLHHSKYHDLWRMVIETARRLDVQVFATTHSWECIKAAASVAGEDDLDDFRYHRIQPIRGKDHVTTYPTEVLEGSLENGAEVR